MQVHGSGFREVAPGDDTDEVDDGVAAPASARPGGPVYGAFNGPGADDDEDDEMELENFCTNCTGALMGDLCLVR